MGEPSPGESSPKEPLTERLDSWKEIAAHFERDVTTVQRWEKREGMPIHRHLHDRAGSVYAFTAELDAWARSRNLRVVQSTTGDAPSLTPFALPPPSPVPAPRSPWRVILPLAAAALLVIGVIVWLQRTEYFWRDPIAGARFQTVTDFEAVEQAAAVSRDGQFVAFLSDRDGQMDVWVTQVGSGQFHNLTSGTQPELVNPSVRTVGFSPDGSLVTFWVRQRRSATSEGDISVWAVPTLGGQPKPYLEGVAEFDWSQDGSRLVYHTPGPMSLRPVRATVSGSSQMERPQNYGLAMERMFLAALRSPPMDSTSHSRCGNRAEQPCT